MASVLFGSGVSVSMKDSISESNLIQIALVIVLQGVLQIDKDIRYDVLLRVKGHSHTTLPLQSDLIYLMPLHQPS